MRQARFCDRAFFVSATLVRGPTSRYIAPRKVGLDEILANPVRAGTQQP